MSKKRILVVDDDEILQAMLKKRLEFHGFECLSAYTVEAALDCLKNMRPDLILVDLGFKKIDGTAFLQHARQWLPENYQMPPMIVLSAHNEKDIVNYCLDEGASGFIAKPFNPDELITMIENYTV